MIRTFFPIVKTDPPTERDFDSHQRLGIPLVDPRDEDAWRGGSLYATFARARSTARRFPTKGQFVAAVRNDDSDRRVRVERTGSRRGHFTAWASPATLLTFVVEVTDVSGLTGLPGRGEP